MTEEESVDGVRVLRYARDFRDLHRLVDSCGTESVDAEFAAVLEREQPHVVHVHHVAGTSARVIPLARERGIPVVVTLHDFWFLCGRGQRWTPWGHRCDQIEHSRCATCLVPKRLAYMGNWLRAETRKGWRGIANAAWNLPGYLWSQAGTTQLAERDRTMLAALRRANLLLAPSRFLLDEFASAGVPRALLRHWEYGMDTTRFAGQQREPIRLDRPIRFGFIGSWLPTKAPHLLLEALSQLERGSAEVVLFGAVPASGPAEYGQRLEKLARELPVRFAGRFSQSEVASAFGQMDVLVIPSLWFENAPLTLLESTLAGVPAITSDLGGMREFADLYGSALCFPPGRSSALAEQMKRFIDDPGLAAELVKRRCRNVRTVEEDVSSLLAEYDHLASVDGNHPTSAGPTETELE